MTDPLSAFRATWLPRIENRLDACLPPVSMQPQKLAEAMRYAVLNGGKRLRPLLVLVTCETFGGEPDKALDAACAVEFIHAYSLIHDDLPAMDDDDLRRGLPTCHIAFDEATAILAGDALQCLAFETLIEDVQREDASTLMLVRELSSAAGYRGMVGGQALDLDATDSRPTLSTLKQIHIAKTARLIEASVLMGAHCAQPWLGESYRQKLRRFARSLGLAFQIRDDIIDHTGSTWELGKTAGKDAAANKATYVTLLGMEAAVDALNAATEEALAFLKADRLEQALLADIVAWVSSRGN